ncbi:MAG TPA: glycosyltransferase [Pyrinomonadaceae bacterium]|jgi:glycosyltransferase involved in cell wall biosynthesis
MKINWFCPLPPARTSIADDFLVGLLPSLSQHSELTLWTDQRSWDRSLEKPATVRHYDPERISWPDLHHADVTFYNIGNNHLFHASIWQVSRRHPGIVILHDLRVHNFFDSLYRAQWRDTAGYLAHVKRCYGDEGLRAATEFVNGTMNIDFMTEHYPLTPLALENCLAVVVHTQEALEQVQAMREWPVAYASLPRTLPPQRDDNAALRSAKPPYRLIMFGYMGRNRRLDAVLEALAALPERDSFRLEIFGEIADGRGLRKRIGKLGLAHLVQLHGYTTETELNQVMQTSHLAINLRYPTMGEASGSQLRIWYHALPSLVTDVGWYSSLSRNTVAHVRPENEIADIQSHLRAFLQDPKLFATMGERGLRTLHQEHDPEKYVRTILELAANARDFRVRKSAYDLARRAGTAMGSMMGSSPSSAAIEPIRVAEKIYEIFGP